MTKRRDIGVVASVPITGAPGRKVIATIGIDRYDHWQRLANAVRDATRSAELFMQLGFEQLTAPLLDGEATAKAIQSLVTGELKKRLRPDDSLVLFYAGHGATFEHRPGGEQIKTGYLIPTDAASSPDDVATWVDLEGWLRAVALLPAKHILVILDACRSGIALDGVVQRHRGDDELGPEALAPLQARRSRRIITSALGDQVALDSGPQHGHSLFTGCLLEGLSYDLRRRGDRTMTGSGLGTYLQRRVDTYTKSQQTPDFGTFYHDDRGELTIALLDQVSDHATPSEAPITTRQTVSRWPIARSRPVFAAIAVLAIAGASFYGIRNIGRESTADKKDIEGCRATEVRCEQGDPNECLSLGVDQMNGRCGPKDLNLACDTFQRACEADKTRSDCVPLGRCYKQGLERFQRMMPPPASTFRCPPKLATPVPPSCLPIAT